MNTAEGGLTMNAKRIAFVLAVAAGLAMLAACKGGGPTDPNPPDPPGELTFKGTVTSGGTALAGVQVFLSGDASKSVVTDGNGAFTFAGISGNTFVVTPSLRDHAFSPSKYELGTQSRSDLNFTASAAVYGSVVDKIAADFAAVDQNGSPVSLYQYFGKVVLIDFSADWCGPCREEAGKAEALYQAYKARGFEMITILTSGSTSAWASQYGLTFRVLDDGLQSLWSIYGEGYIPLNIILDRNMTIRYKTAGYLETEITATIKKYL